MRVALVCCPEWSVHAPPYGMSLLKSILVNAGHEAKNFDFNIEAHDFLKDEDLDYWGGQNFFYWEHGEFDNILLPKLDSLMDQWVDRLIRYRPDFIGFTTYHTNIRCTQNIIDRIKSKGSKVTIVMGGPQCFSAGKYPPYLGMADYICTGEGEHAILNMLERPENRALGTDGVININDNPICNYDDYDLTKYDRKKGVSLEASRGCIAKCSFCMETHFWLYRSKKGERIVEEMKEYNKRYGFRAFRFNDSLVNGNIKQFYSMVDVLSKENDLDIQWDGYARIDGKMDLEFMQKIKDSGNEHLSYGVESASQKVLDDMRKGITVEEVEQNLIDSYKTGLKAHVNWIVGFPSEDVLDHTKSLVFLFNNSKYINGISPGMTCGIGDKADLKLNPEKYGIEEKYYWNNWITKDFKNTAIHRQIRLKCTHILIDLLGNMHNGQYHKNLPDHFDLKLVNETPIVDKIDLSELIDFSYLHKGTFHSSLHSEFIAFFWVLYKIYGQYEMTLNFDREKDIAEFGTMIAKEYNATAKISVNSNGKWTCSLVHQVFDHKPFNESVTLKGQF